MGERKLISDMMVGEKVEGVYILSEISTTKENKVLCTLKDKGGSLLGECTFPATEKDLASYLNGAVKVSFIVKPTKNGVKTCSIKGLERADRSEYKSSELFDGLSDEVIEKYKGSVIANLRHIKGELQPLVSAIFTEETFQMLSSYPATVYGFAKYRGGALAVTANVLQQVKNIGVSYVQLANGLYSDNIDWSLVLCAAALIELSVSDAYTNEEPFVKKASCIERGYGSLLQSAIDKAIQSNALEIGEETYSRLLNCLWCVVEQHAQISPTSKEGVLLQQAYSTYKRLDNFDLYRTDVANESESGYSYSTDCRQYVSNKEVERLA